MSSSAAFRDICGHPRFAAAQILALVVGIEPEYDKALRHTAARLAGSANELDDAISPGPIASRA